MSRELIVTAALPLCVILSVLPQAARGDVAPASGTATLPLTELFELKRASESAQRHAEPAPPLRAAVNRLEIAGRLLDTGLSATALVEVTVLGQGWVTVPLLEVRESTHLASLPAVEEGVLAVVGGRLCLVTEKAGTQTFTFGWLERPSARAGRSRSVEVLVPAGSPAVLRLEHDESLFRLASHAAREEGTGAVLYPAGGRITVAWEQVAPDRRRAPAPARPPVEPVVTSAHASVVATLEGRRITRVQYRLRFTGQKTFALTLAPGHAVERVFLNGAARPFTVSGNDLSLPVEAARAGDQTATVEMVTSESQPGYPLSGTLSFTLPRPRWGVNDLFVTLHLPPVFDYRWAGGSLAAGQEAPRVEYAWDIPTPGKTLELHQQLVSSFANVQVAYTVDLTKSYFR
jgi:hypothetical protein